MTQLHESNTTFGPHETSAHGGTKPDPWAAPIPPAWMSSARIIALDRALRWAELIAKSGSADGIVQAAEKFHSFLAGDQPATTSAASAEAEKPPT